MEVDVEKRFLAFACLPTLLLVFGCKVPLGAGWTTLGGPGSGSGIYQFHTPTGIRLDDLGRIYVADQNNNRIERMDNMNGANWTALGTPPSGQSGNGQFWLPTGITLDANGLIYVADQFNGRITRMSDMSGTGWTAWGSWPAYQPTGVALDSSGRIYVTDYLNNRIARIDNMSGANPTTLPLVGTSSGSGIGQFNQATTTVVDASGHIYVADFSNNRIVRMDDMTGTNWTTLGGPGSGAGTGQFNTPAGIALDEHGRIYVADSGNNRIVRMDSMSGANWVTFGTLGSGDDQFNSPAAVLVFSGWTYVADSGNNRIARFVIP